jgi:hypothetical protein
MSWQKMKKAKEEGGSGGLYITLKDGDSIEGVFRGEPYCFYQKFQEKTEYESWSEGRSFKFKINFIIKEGDKFIAKIYRGGATVRDALLMSKEEYGLDCIFKIKRMGSSKEDTTYSVLFKSNLTPEQKAQIDSIKLYEFKKNSVVNEEPIGEEDVPF